MITYALALQKLQDAAVGLPAETVAIADASGRVLAGALHSSQCLPPFDNSAMDGFALAADAEVIAAGTEFDVQGWQAAGDARATATAGAWEIMTGARLPEGLDRVVPVEQVEVLDQVAGRPARIRLLAPVPRGQHVRLRGQDVATGEPVLAAGVVLATHAITLLHALGIAQVQVTVRPRVAVIATGKELVSDPAQTLQSGQIRDSNRPYLVARLQAAGAEVVLQTVVGDDVAAFDDALDRALAAGAQLVLSTGAVSAGRYDFIPDALRARSAEILFHKVAIRPGKPVLFARLGDGTLYLGLPGNPVSTAVGQRFFVEPVLRRMLGLADEAGLRLPLQEAARKPEGLRFHARAKVALDARGALSVQVLSGQESFRLASTLQANAWAVLEEGGEQAAAGSVVQVFGWGHAEPLQLTNQEVA